MSDNKKNSDQKAFVERRSSHSGITSGGRRKSDHQLIEGGGRKWRILIAFSFGISACIMAWALSLPFRGENAVVTFGSAEKKAEDVQVRRVSYSEGQESDEEYLQDMMYMEQELRQQVQEKNRVPKRRPGKEHAKKAWKRGLQQRVNDAKLLMELADGEVEKGTIEWQAQQDLREYLKDAPQ